jgi:hypothetical protein
MAEFERLPYVALCLLAASLKIFPESHERVSIHIIVVQFQCALKCESARRLTPLYQVPEGVTLGFPNHQRTDSTLRTKEVRDAPFASG